ncbi:MAG: glycosyltransferase family 4 protein [Bacteroidota bacterium]
MSQKRVLMIVENLPVPADRRVWQEATALSKAGYKVCVICPTGKGFDRRYERVDDIHIYRHPLPVDARNSLGYIAEYSAALFWEFVLAWKIFFRHGFDVIHGCNPPDLIFLVALVFKPLGKKFIFDHHDINPELFKIKYGKEGMMYRILGILERLTFFSANVSIATNDSYRRIAIERGGMAPDKVFVVRSGPDLSKLRACEPRSSLAKGRRFLVGYIGVMGSQDDVDKLLRVAHCLVHRMGRHDVQFLLIGGGPELARMKALAEELEVGDYVTLSGFLLGDELCSAMSSIDIGVGPDAKNDYNDKCTMNKIMEYMAFSKPVVQFDLTEGRATAHEASLYIKDNNEEEMARCIVDLLDDPEKRAQMGQLGRKRIEDVLDWKYEVPHLLAAYTAVSGSQE